MDFHSAVCLWALPIVMLAGPGLQMDRVMETAGPLQPETALEPENCPHGHLHVTPGISGCKQQSRHPADVSGKRVW